MDTFCHAFHTSPPGNQTTNQTTKNVLRLIFLLIQEGS